MDYTILSNEISQPQYGGMTDGEIAVALSAVSIPVRRRVPISELQARAMETGIYTALRTVVGNAQSPAELRAVAQTVLDLANARFQDVDLDNPASAQMFGVLRQAGVISLQQAAAIDALATERVISRAEQIGLTATITVEDIERARVQPQIDALRVRLALGYNAAVALLDAAQVVPEWADLVEAIEAA